MSPEYSQNPISSAKTLKQRIMRRIYFIFLLRNIAPFAFDVLVLAIVVFAVTLFVSVRDVLSNFSTAASGSSAVQFSIAAVSGTKLQTKLLLLLFGVVGFFSARHLRKAIQAFRLVHGKTAPKEKPPVHDT